MMTHRLKVRYFKKRKQKSHHLWPGLTSPLWMFLPLLRYLLKWRKINWKIQADSKRENTDNYSPPESVNTTLQPEYEGQSVPHADLGKMKFVLDVTAPGQHLSSNCQVKKYLTIAFRILSCLSWDTTVFFSILSTSLLIHILYAF